MGDKRNAIRKLQSSAKHIKYVDKLDLNEINIGSPREYLKLYHYVFLDYSPIIASEIINKHQIELNSKNDKSFVDGIYKLLRNMFDYVPKLTKDQFFTTSYAQVKATMASEIIQLIQQKLKHLQPLTTSVSHTTTTQAPSSSSSTIHNASTVTASLKNNGVPSASILSQQVHVMANQQSHTSMTLGRSSSSRKASSNLMRSASHHSRGDLNERKHLPTSASSHMIKPQNHKTVIQNHFNHVNNLDLPTNVHERQIKNECTDDEVPDNYYTESIASHDDNGQLDKNVQEFNYKLDMLLNRLEIMENFMKTKQKTSSCDENARVSNSHIESTGPTIQVNKNEFETLQKRLTLLENETLVLKHQISMLNYQQQQQQQQPLPPHQQQRRKSVLNNEKSQTFQSDNDEDNDQTAFLSFVNTSNIDDENEYFQQALAKTNGSYRTRSSNSTSSSECQAQVETSIERRYSEYSRGRQHLTHQPRKGISQGVLCDVDDMADVMDDLTLNTSTNPNDLTPTMIPKQQHQLLSNKTTTNRRNISESDESSANSILRAKQLIDRASQLNEQLTVKAAPI